MLPQIYEEKASDVYFYIGGLFVLIIHLLRFLLIFHKKIEITCFY